MEPKIRFKGFEDSWIGRKLTDVVSLYNGLTYTPNSIREKGTLVLRSSNVQDGEITLNDNVYVESSVVNSPNVEKGDIIVVVRNGSRALIGKHAQIKNVMKDTVIGAFMAGMRSENPEFTNALLGTPRFDYEVGINLGATINQITNATFHSMSFGFPSNKEQKAIGKYFTSLDSQISASTSRLASLKQMKAASLQAMFPQEGETVPKIRFKGFEGEWKKVKLSEILTERHENSTITDSLPQLSFTIADGVIRPEDRKSNKRDFLIKDIDNKRYLVTKVGDIIYNPANVVYGAIHRNSLMNGVVSPIYKIFTTMQDSNFIECAVRRPSFITKLAMCTEGTVTKLKTLKPEAFLNMEVCITPSLEEQKLIGNYFTSLDRQISLQSQRLEKLKQIKSACLDKMFV